jgi:hypothetical protein
VSLLTELDAFYTDHRLCGGLDAGVDGPRCRPAVCSPPAEALIDARSPRYFRTHLFVGISHTPLAFSQSAGVVYFAKSSEVCDGLAEGELDGSPDTRGAVVAPLGPPDAAGGFVSLPE